MNQQTKTHLDSLRSQDREAQNKAFAYILKETEKPVDWAYEVWDDLVGDLRHKDNHIRAIAAQVLANLAKSDPKNRMQKDFPALLAVTKDERFVTARHTLQSIWKIGIQPKMQKTVVDGLAYRFQECASEKNCTLIRYDIIQDLRNLYDELKDETIKKRALALIEMEDDGKYKKKYTGVWK
jgi:hypothetical protein